MTSSPLLTEHGAVTLYDFHPPVDDLCADVALGLSGAVKRLSPKYFYDERGAQLFEQICNLEAYYPTRIERSILAQSMPEIASEIGAAAWVIEFGSGSGLKTRILLEHLDSPAVYTPIDISRTQLVHFALSVAEQFPWLEVLPVCADYTRNFTLPSTKKSVGRRMAFFPGSTIGNFEPEEAVSFLRRVGERCGPGGGLLIGVDMKKDAEVLERAYNDPEGITAAFNLNLLRRINRECGANFDMDAFRHHAFFDAEHSRIEMRLISQDSQTVRLPNAGSSGGVVIEFSRGEHITTEYSYKYDPEEFDRMVQRAGWRVERVWTDEKGWFGVWLLGRERR